jgi:hypothetical protein
MRRIIYALLFITLIFFSGCLGEKTVIKATLKISEQNGEPVIEVMNVRSARVSITEDYKETSSFLPGIYMKTIWNMKQIDYWRSIEYRGSGEYEIISELKEIPPGGERVDIIINVMDVNGNQTTSRKVMQKWE